MSPVPLPHCAVRARVERRRFGVSRIAACVGVCLCVSVLGSCSDALEPQGQLLLHVDTDALLPTEPGLVRPEGLPPALFDRLRVDVLPPGEGEPCEGCSHEAAVYHESMLRGVSFGVMSRPGVEGYRARIRLYRESFVVDGEPLGRCAIDTWVSLPALSAEGVVEGSVLLRTEDVGRSVGDEAAVGWVAGPPGPSRAGTWEGARRQTCSGTPDPGQVCVPGGAFWMGSLDVVAEFDSVDEPAPRLVVISPFYLDIAEITVGEMRASGLAELVGGESVDPRRWSGNSFDSIAEDRCSFPLDPEDSSRDERPVNCFSKGLAERFCGQRGASLPSEAQLEYVSGALASRRYVWGADYPSCEDAVFGRAGRTRGSNMCLTFGTSPGALLGGAAQRDRLAMGGSEVLDLAGNLAELSRDSWNRQTEPCWSPPLLVDPLCERPSSADVDKTRTIRGGSWASPPFALAASYRRSAPDAYSVKDDKGAKLTLLGPLVGFRCARPGGKP